MESILLKENILTNQSEKPKEEVIREIGRRLLIGGYIEVGYLDGMLEKETVFNTNIGNQIAIPHGIESSRNYILKTGIVVLTFPEGTDWGDGERVKVVVGIAGKGQEHMDILEKIAVKLSEPVEVECFMQYSQDEIYQMFVEE